VFGGCGVLSLDDLWFSDGVVIFVVLVVDGSI